MSRRDQSPQSPQSTGSFRRRFFASEFCGEKTRYNMFGYDWKGFKVCRVKNANFELSESTPLSQAVLDSKVEFDSRSDSPISVPVSLLNEMPSLHKPKEIENNKQEVDSAPLQAYQENDCFTLLPNSANALKPLNLKPSPDTVLSRSRPTQNQSSLSPVSQTKQQEILEEEEMVVESDDDSLANVSCSTCAQNKTITLQTKKHKLRTKQIDKKSFDAVSTVKLREKSNLQIKKAADDDEMPMEEAISIVFGLSVEEVLRLRSSASSFMEVKLQLFSKINF